MRDVKPLLLESDFPQIRRKQIQTLQLNLGYLCNLSCSHCHVNAGPHRKELMNRDTMQLALDLIDQYPIQNLDLTGGSPEMNPDFYWLIEQAKAKNVHIMDRCNPTILMEPGYEHLTGFLAEHQVEIIASLPCYLEDNVDAQRGKGVFSTSIQALQKLNASGYGHADSRLKLNLVYNPQGATLPPEQTQLEQAYKQFLSKEFDIQFNQLYTITNMPIQRFGATLAAHNLLTPYLATLKQAFMPENIENLMCRSLLSIDWQGYLYDCDFNQMLDLPLSGKKIHLKQLTHQIEAKQTITVAQHCYGCTAGQGSSCTGQLS